MEHENGSEARPATFEQAFEAAEKAVASLERGELTLEESIAEYEQGLGALRRCYGILQQAQKRVEVLSGGQDLETALTENSADAEKLPPVGGASTEVDGSSASVWKAASSVPPLKEALDRIDGDVPGDPRASRGATDPGADSPQVSSGDD